MPLAARLDALIIIGLIRGITPPGQTHAQSMAYFAEAMRACAETAQAAGARLAIEPLNRYETDLIHTIAEGLAFLETVGMNNVGLLLDTFHMNIEEPSIGESIEAAISPADGGRPADGGCLVHFHVADSNCYTGYVSGEFMPQPDAETAAARAITHLRSLG